MQRRGRSRSPDRFPGTATAGRRGAVRTPRASVLGHALHPCRVSAPAPPQQRTWAGRRGPLAGPAEERPEETQRRDEARGAHRSSRKLVAPRWKKPTAMQTSLVNAWSNAWEQKCPQNAKVRRPITRVTGAVHRAEAVPRPRQQPRGPEPEPGHAQRRPGLFPATTYTGLSPLHGAQCGGATNQRVCHGSTEKRQRTCSHAQRQWPPGWSWARLLPLNKRRFFPLLYSG